MSRLATKTHVEREDEEVERLVRPSPKKKPPRRDRRREDVDTDPESDADADLSMNRKNIGGSVVRRWAAASDRVRVKNKETGRAVLVAPETLKSESGKYEPLKDDGSKGADPEVPEKPKSKKVPKPKSKGDAGDDGIADEDRTMVSPVSPEASPKKTKQKGGEKPKKPQKGDDAPEEVEEEPSEAERAGIGPPKREPPSKLARMQAAQLLIDTFPANRAADLMSLHPDDVRELVTAYNSAKSSPLKDSDVASFAKDVGEFYETDPRRVEPPVSWQNAQGKRVPFDSLPTDEKSEAMRQYQVRVVAVSMAAQDKLTEKYTRPSLFNKPKIPPDLAETLAKATLRGGSVDRAMADEMFQAAFEGGVASKLRKLGTKDSDVKGLLKLLPEGARDLAIGYFQAADYQEAKHKFLGKTFSERSNSKAIFSGIMKAKTFLGSRDKQYGAKDPRSTELFEYRVMDRLRTLEPAKYKDVRRLMDVEDAKQYKSALAQWDKDLAKWEAKKKEWESSLTGRAYRDKAFDEPPPPEPKKPPRLDTVEPPQKAESLLEDLKANRTKVAARVRSRFLSETTCSSRSLMASSKTSVYHGVDPLDHYPEPYPKWGPAHQRDLGDSDYETLVKAARAWLSSPVLSKNVDGVTQDQQVRAALDLAIQDGRYNGQIDAPTYGMLLARLTGAPEMAAGHTLQAATSLYKSTQSGQHATQHKVTSMNASNELRKLAQNLAARNAKVAFDLVALADKLAEQESEKEDSAKDESEQKKASEQEDSAKDESEQKKEASDKYASLKALVIHTAASDESAKKVLTPVLLKIRELG